MSKVSGKTSNATILIVVFFAIVCFSIVIYCFALPVGVRKTAEKYAEKYGLDGALVCAVIKAESGFDANAVSVKGACGLMQITPSTFEFVLKRYGLPVGDIFDPEDNIRAGCAYLRYLLDIFSTERETLCAYNAGEGTLRSWLDNERYSSDKKTLKKIPFKETENYLKKIKFYYSLYKGI